MELFDTHEVVEDNVPDVYRAETDGHWVDVDNSTYDREKIKVHFVTPRHKEIEIDLTLKDAMDLKRELKAAILLVSIAENY